MRCALWRKHSSAMGFNYSRVSHTGVGCLPTFGHPIFFIMKENAITIQVTVLANAAKAWNSLTNPEHIVNWNFASSDWHCPKSSNDVRVGGKMVSTMAARDGSMSFDFEGVYTEVREFEFLAFTMPDGREVQVRFESQGDTTNVIETFDPEDQNPLEMQRAGWFAILENYKKHAEGVLA